MPLEPYPARCARHLPHGGRLGIRERGRTNKKDEPKWYDPPKADKVNNQTALGGSYHLRECFLSLRAKEVMMCGDPFGFFRWTSMQERKIPRVGIFYFACFSKNGRNHSGEWFDFRKKALKSSIKSMHGQQLEKWWVWKIFVVTGWGIVVECG